MWMLERLNNLPLNKKVQIFHIFVFIIVVYLLLLKQILGLFLCSNFVLHEWLMFQIIYEFKQLIDLCCEIYLFY